MLAIIAPGASPGACLQARGQIPAAAFSERKYLRYRQPTIILTAFIIWSPNTVIWVSECVCLCAQLMLLVCNQRIIVIQESPSYLFGFYDLLCNPVSLLVRLARYCSPMDGFSISKLRFSVT